MKKLVQNYKKEIKIISLIFLFKVIILSILPLTGDEAYFIKWAKTLSAGYYDHPPMIGWTIHFMSYISDNIVFFRMLSVVTTFIVAYTIFKIGELYIEKSRAFFIALLFLASPVDILLSLITNDIVLVLFGSLGAMFLLFSMEKTNNKILYATLSGIFLGFAFLSKYFAVFLMVSLLLFVLFTYKTKAIKNVLIVTFFILLAVAQNLWFNYNSCWNNIMFNFLIRTSSQYSLESVTNYFIMVIYLFSPWGIWFLFKDRKLFKLNKLNKLILFVLVLILGLFFVVSLKNELGLHWFILFLPYMYLAFAYLSEETLQKLFKYNYIFTFIHVALLLVILFLPISLFKDAKYYSDIVYATNPKKICNELKKYNNLYTFGYTTASMLSYSCKRDIKMVFSGSKFGRLDDKLLDVRTLNGKNIAVFDNGKIVKKDFRGVCSDVKVDKFNVMGAEFYVGECKNFNYKKYKQTYLKSIKEKYYNIPKWLPVGKCYFTDRYFK